MILFRLHILLALLLFMVVDIRGQGHGSDAEEVERLIMEAVDELDPDIASDQSELIIQTLYELTEDPLNINTAPVEKLIWLPGLNLVLAQRIVGYRERIKPFESARELEEVEGIGPVTLQKILPFVTAGPVVRLLGNRRYWLSNSRLEWLSRYQRDIETREGYRRDPAEGYAGGPARIYQRMSYRSNHLSANMTLEKDPGEPLNPATEFDYQSAHIAVENVGLIRRWVIGDYSISAGQGLLFWNGGAFGKGSQVVAAVNRNERGLQPWRSAREYGFYRGMAVTAGKQLQVTGLYSRRRKDARRLSEQTVRLTSETGLHRTRSELEKKQQITETVLGGRIRGQFAFGFLGLTGYRSRFDRTVVRSKRLSDRHEFGGHRLWMVGADFNLTAGSVVLFGEIGRGDNGAVGMVAGLQAPLDGDTDLLLSYRSYDRHFQSLHGDGFGEQSGIPSNEEGFYVGLRHRLSDKVAVRGYIDQFRFPSPRFGTSRETKGFDWLGQLEIRPHSKLIIILRTRGEKKEDEYDSVDSLGRRVRLLAPGMRKSFRLQLEYRVNPAVRLRARGEMVLSRDPGAKRETGYLIYQDLRFSPGRKWRIDARATIFDTGGYSSRVYQFENDMLYVFSSKVLLNRGQRLYLLVKVEPLPFLDCWAKYGITVYEDQLFLGSGLDRIEGNRRSEVGVQMRVRF